MSHVLKHNVADQIAYFRAYDTDGTAKTDLTSSTAGLTLSVFRVGASSVSIASLSAKAADDSTHADGAIRNVGGNLYTIDIPDAATATQVPSIVVRGSYTGGVVEGLEHPIVAYDPAVNYASATKAADIETDTQDIQSRLPATLTGGFMQAYVVGSSSGGADSISSRIAINIVDGSYSWPSALGEIADAVYDEPYAGHTTPGTYGFLWDKWRKSNPAVTGEVTSAVTPTTTTFSTDITGYADTAFDNAVLVFINGSTNADFRGVVSGYLQVNGQVTITPALPTPPVAGDEFTISIPSFVYTLAQVQSGLATSAELTEIKGATWSSSTDTLEAIRDASGGGGGTVVIAPIQAEVPPRSVETLLRVYRGETVDQIVSVVESDGTTPVDLSGKTLEIVFEGYLGTDLAVIATANITVSGDDNNVVTFAYPSAVTATVGRYYWSLRDDAAPSQVYLNGEVEVLRAAVNDP
jgi:hypothetical protein